MEMKYRRNIITFLEARKIVDSYIKDNTYAIVALKVSKISYSNKNSQPDKCRVLIEKLVQLGHNDLLTFQKELKKL